METACAFQVMKHYTYSNLSTNSQRFVSSFFHLISSLAETFVYAIDSYTLKHFDGWFLSMVWRYVAKWSNLQVHLHGFWYCHGKPQLVTCGIHPFLHCKVTQVILVWNSICINCWCSLTFILSILSNLAVHRNCKVRFFVSFQDLLKSRLCV